MIYIRLNSSAPKEPRRKIIIEHNCSRDEEVQNPLKVCINEFTIGSQGDSI